jgi:hypothetical protein
LLFWGYLRVDLAEIRFVLLLFSLSRLVIQEGAMQSVRPIDLAPVAEQISPVNGAINHVITIAPAPLLPGEKQADYEGVAAGIVKAAQPRDMIEDS